MRCGSGSRWRRRCRRVARRRALGRRGHAHRTSVPLRQPGPLVAPLGGVERRHLGLPASSPARPLRRAQRRGAGSAAPAPRRRPASSRPSPPAHPPPPAASTAPRPAPTRSDRPASRTLARHPAQRLGSAAEARARRRPAHHRPQRRRQTLPARHLHYKPLDHSRFRVALPSDRACVTSCSRVSEQRGLTKASRSDNCCGRGLGKEAGPRR